MVKEEFFHSDIIYPSGRIVLIDEFEKEYPNWFAIWNKYFRENTSDKYILITDYDYGISAIVNALYLTDFDKAVATYICSFGENGEEENLYHTPIRIGNKLIFAPSRSHRWAIYDLERNKWVYEEIPMKFLPEEGKIFVKSWKQVNDSLIYMPGDKGIMVKLDCKSAKVTYHDCLKGAKKPDERIPDFSSMVAYKGAVLLFSNEDNRVYEIDALSMSLKQIYKINIECKGIKSAFVLPKTDWIYLIKNRVSDENDWKESIIKWNLKENRVIEIRNLPINPCENASMNLISGFCYNNGDLYAIPLQGDSFLKINLQTDQVERVEIETGHGLLERKDDYYRRWGNGVAFPMLIYNGKENTFTATLPYDFSLAEIDFENKKLYNNRKWRVYGSEKLLRFSQAQRFEGGFVENDYFSLKEFIGELV